MAQASGPASLSYDQVKERAVESFKNITGFQWGADMLLLNPIVESPSLVVASNTNSPSSSSAACCASSELEQTGPTLEEELNLFRDVMLMMKIAPKGSQVETNYISRNFTYLLLRNLSGFRKWISATFDLDETSQKETTLDQRFIAASQVVAYIPTSCVPLPLYYHLVAKQVWYLLLSHESLKEFTKNCVAKICALTVTSMIARKKKLGKKEFIAPVIRGLQPLMSKDSCPHGCCNLFTKEQIKHRPCHITFPQASLEIIYFLAIANLDMKHLSEAFAPLLYIQLTLESSLSPWKSKCLSVLIEMLRRVKHSIHLLMAALFVHYDRFHNVFCLVHEASEGRAVAPTASSAEKLAIAFISSSTSSSQEPIDIKKIDALSFLVLNLIDSAFESEGKVNFVLLLFEQLSSISTMSQSTSLLLCTLFGELMVTIEPLIERHPGLFIKFIIPSLKRVVEDAESGDRTSASRIPLDTEQAASSPEEDEAVSLLQQDSLQISLQILKVLLLHKEKLSCQDIESLKSTAICLNKIRESLHLSSESSSPSDRDGREEGGHISQELPKVTADEIGKLINEISELCPNESSARRKEATSELDNVLKELNDPLMPTRAHGLISLKHMIMAMNPEVIGRKRQILELLIASLADDESYIYLASINTLEAAAILDTPTVLPVLLCHFANPNRTIQERLNTGEAIVRLCKSLGPTAPIYAKCMVETFTESLKDQEVLIRVSSLSNLSQICKCLRHSLAPYITTIMHSIGCLLTSDASVEVKRAALMFIHLTLSGVDMDCIVAIQDVLVPMLKLVRSTYASSLDDVCRLHSQMALEELERLAKQLAHKLTFGTSFEPKPAKPVQIIQ